MTLAARLLLLTALAVLATAAPEAALAEQRAGSLRPEAALARPAAAAAGGAAARLGDGVCDICTNAIQSMEQYISDPETQANMAKFLDEQVCDQLPDSIAGTCKLEVPIVVNMVIVMMEQSIPPVTICEYMGLCDGSKPGPAPASAPWTALVQSATAKAGLAGPFDCPACKMVVQLAVQRLQDPALRAQIQADIDAACDTMPAPDQARCHGHVLALFKALDDLLHDVDPNGVCQLALFCPRSPRQTPLTAAPAALSQLKASFRTLASLPPTDGSDALFDSCESCKTIVTEAAAIIQDPTTQREILDYAKQGCDVFQDFKTQCETYVDLYGPLILSMALQYLQPLPLCTRMGYCQVTPPAVRAS